MTDKNYLSTFRQPTAQDPLRVLMSACLAGITCGYDGSNNGEYPSALKLLNYNTVKIVKFCPEEFYLVHQEKCATYMVVMVLTC